jgi:hypothetical protein
MLAGFMRLLQRRFTALGLALLLLFTQQWGLRHVVAHGGLPTAVSVAAAHTPAAVDAVADDGLCQVCLVLAGWALGALAPALALWHALRARHRTPLPGLLGGIRAGVPAAYCARAPPIALALT